MFRRIRRLFSSALPFLYLLSPGLVAAFGPGQIVNADERFAVFALSMWQLAMLLVVLGSPRRVLLGALPVAVLVPPYVYFCLKFGSVPGDAMVAAIMYTSPAQSVEVVAAFGATALVAWLAVVLMYILIAWRTDASWRMPMAGRKAGIAVLLGVVGVMLLLRELAPQAVELPPVFEPDNIARVFPGNLARSALRARERLSPPSRWTSVDGKARPEWRDQSLLVVFVIGESVRPDHLSLYGYPRETTPNLRAMSDALIQFSDVASTAHFTFMAVTNLVSIKTPDGPASLVKTFSQAGFATAWLSNQERTFLSEGADQTAHANGPFDFHFRRDSALLTPFVSFTRQAGPRQFIVLHMNGSHFPYEERYGADAKRFSPTLGDRQLSGHPGPEHKTEAINSYDNTLVELDRFLGSLFHVLKSETRPALLVFTSDHGENLFDDSRNRFMHALQTPSSWDTQVPLIIWSNAAYQALNPGAIERLRMRTAEPVGHRDLFPTLLDLAGIDWAHAARHVGLASSSWLPHERLLETFDGLGPDFDELRRTERLRGFAAKRSKLTQNVTSH
ncbi:MULTISPECIES: phosphoethanolamine transferase [Roseateles]|uniref:Glucan phosphoethanolaminetransferase (Alkaline phosphatase superfamily) n=1 Tax=Pelomonas aquatica TaxID=431058 RepID=A0ABU1ZG67_9BURK|nr:MULTISPECIES: phosphoethanolamine transferase [Roseateles]KQY85392.1 hypothetical protein ASD35_22500 [Pelomonas sp. Root1444]MDR7299630.1 glucan phosphoethanolaminetransferase (alkaline phosphatase superfamily) [Pelomonas aquatica]